MAMKAMKAIKSMKAGKINNVGGTKQKAMKVMKRMNGTPKNAMNLQGMNGMKYTKINGTKGMKAMNNRYGNHHWWTLPGDFQMALLTDTLLLSCRGQLGLSFTVMNSLIPSRCSSDLYGVTCSRLRRQQSISGQLCVPRLPVHLTA